jgi:hypothetical protein
MARKFGEERRPICGYTGWHDAINEKGMGLSIKSIWTASDRFDNWLDIGLRYVAFTVIFRLDIHN